MKTRCSLSWTGGLKLTLSFDTPEAEAAYYRERYRLILDMLNDTRAELGEPLSPSRSS